MGLVELSGLDEIEEIVDIECVGIGFGDDGVELDFGGWVVWV